MRLKNGEIYNSAEPLKRLLEEKFPVKVSYSLAKLANKLQEQLTVIEGVRQGLIKTYGEANPENPQQIRVNPEGENFQKFVSELNELFEQEVEVVFEKVKLPEKVASKCEKCEAITERPLEIEPSVLMNLEKFIEVA